MTLAANVLLLQFVIIVGDPTKPDNKPTISPLPAILSGDQTSPKLSAIASGVQSRSPELPAILSADQSLPATMVLPKGAVPIDIAEMKTTASQVEVVTTGDNSNLVDKVLMQTSPVQSNVEQYPVTVDQANNVVASTNMKNGQIPMQVSLHEAIPNVEHVEVSPYPPGPVNHDSTYVKLNNAPTSMESSILHDVSKVPDSEQAQYNVLNDQVVNNAVPSRPRNIGKLPLQNLQPAIPNNGHTHYPMSMAATIDRWSSSMVLMNIQTACHSLQTFVLGTPLATEIMTSVSNMEIMPSQQPKHCGLPALSASLRMFLRTCRMYTSCPVLTYMSFPTSFQHMSPAVPYMVQQQNPKPRPNTSIQTQQNTNSIRPVVNRTRMPRPKRPTRKESIIRNHPGWVYGFRALQAGIQGLRQRSLSRTTPEPTGSADD